LERYCFELRIKPGMEEEYDRRHKEVWPELTSALKAAGIANYSLFRRGLRVIGYAECYPDAMSAWRSVEVSEVDRRWQEWMEDVIESRLDDDGNPLVFQELWHLD
jgi:L-rhamnose mutarotase